MRILSRAAITALIIGTPLIASAATIADLTAQLQALLTQLQALQSAQSSQTTTTTTTTSGNTASAVGACISSNMMLKPGMSGPEISALQHFLASDSTIYPEALVTGYYGSLTQAAVARWQTRAGIVTSGTPETTGYGLVGPKTAAAIALACTTGVSAQGGGLVGGSVKVSPVSGTAPLSVSAQVTVNSTKSCSASTYTLDWGDGAPAQTITVPSGNCTELQQTFTHQYSYGGTYAVRLSAGTHQSTVNVSVSGPTNIGTGATSGSTANFKATPTSGATPLVVSFSGIVTSDNKAWCSSGCTNTLEFGDGTSAQVPLPISQGAYSFSVQHTYQSAGAFTAKLHQGTVAESSLVGSPITITASGTGSGVRDESITATPTTGNAPLTVHITGVVNSNDAGWCATGCSATLAFGDGTTALVPLPTAHNVAQTFAVDKTYASAGTYTIRLYQGAQGAPLVGTPITLTVGGTSSVMPAESLSASSTTGISPLRVTFTGVVTGADPSWCSTCNDTLEFGDGTNVQVPLPHSTTGVNSFTAEHTYVTPGNYVAVLYPSSKNAGYAAIGTVTVSVAAQ